MKLWWGNQRYWGIVVAANSLQEATICIQKTKHFDNPQINPNSIGFINSTQKQAYVICNSNPIIHDDFEDEVEVYDDLEVYDEFDNNTDDGWY